YFQFVRAWDHFNATFGDPTAHRHLGLSVAAQYVNGRINPLAKMDSLDATESARRRLGLSARIIPPRVKVNTEKMRPYFPELGVQLIRGEDTLGLNRLVAAPSGAGHFA